MSLRILDLDSLSAPAGRVVLHGEEHDVLPFDGASFHLMAQLQKEQERLSKAEATPSDHLEFLSLACKLAHRIVPTLSGEQVAKLSDKQLAAILQLGAGQVDAVEAMIAHQQGNAKAPASKKRRARAL